MECKGLNPNSYSSTPCQLTRVLTSSKPVVWVPFELDSKLVHPSISACSQESVKRRESFLHPCLSWAFGRQRAVRCLLAQGRLNENRSIVLIGLKFGKIGKVYQCSWLTIRNPQGKVQCFQSSIIFFIFGIFIRIQSVISPNPYTYTASSNLISGSVKTLSMTACDGTPIAVQDSGEPFTLWMDGEL